MNKVRIFFVSLILLKNSFANIFSENLNQFMLLASIGYTNYQEAYNNDGQTAVGRLAFSNYLLRRKKLQIGLELGLQNGNTMRLGVDQATLNELGGLPIQSTVKPLLDLLVTVKSSNLDILPLFIEFKGGIAYRRWQFDDRETINDLSEAAGEVQAGVGYRISESATLNIFYQGIYGDNPRFLVNTTNFTGKVSSIPIQQGVLLTLAYQM